MADKMREFVRFTLAQRIEHIILIFSFTLLAVTGLPQKYVGNAFAEDVIVWMGGIERVRLLHHFAAITFVVQSIYHLLVLGYKIFVQHTEMSMLPGVKDMSDAIAVVKFNLGLTRERPLLPRYSFEEKAEYWAMLWGTVTMAVTGFVLWNPISAARIMPGAVIPAAKAMHGGEALLAVLAIIVWHFYNVHVKHFNRAMFTGKLDEHKMHEEHGAELQMISSGRMRPRPEPEVVRRRQRVFLPIAGLAAILALAGVFWLATNERTAIAGMPAPQSTAPVFAPLTPTPVAPGVAPAPAATSAQGAGAPQVIPHPIEGREDCLLCHKLDGIQPMPVNHEGRGNTTCTACHKLAAGVTGERPAAGGTPAPGGTPAAGGASGTAAISAVPHAIAGMEKCDTCHGPTGLKPYPTDHAGRPNEQCTVCHKPQGAAGGAATTAGSRRNPGRRPPLLVEPRPRRPPQVARRRRLPASARFPMPPRAWSSAARVTPSAA